MATWVVTGANRGIGLELCRQIAARGDDVLAVCRTTSKELDGLGGKVKVVAGVDVTSDDAGAKIAAALGEGSIDVLLNNAGILVPGGLDSLDFAVVTKQFEVNAVGPLKLTKALLPKLRKGSKVVLVSSRAGSIGDNGSGGLYGYRMSKAALNMAGMSLARDLAPKGVPVVVLHPGFIRTEMTGGNGNDDPPVAAKGMLARIDETTLERTGKFFHANGEELPW
ncbi:MAG: SDR family oxidoreductase [Deltaproteobacteria bacterium]|nr:SDR family oxidoreductase [Deltaproteobacteria bacterium]